MNIGDAARASGVSAKMISYYEQESLIPPATRSASGYRAYSDQDVQRLRFIRSAQAAGFTLEEISRLLAFDPVDDRPSIRALAERRIAALDEQIRLLQSSRTALTRLARQCGSSDAGPCPIVEAFEA